MHFPTRKTTSLYDVAIYNPLVATYSSQYGQASLATNLRDVQKLSPTLYVKRAIELGFAIQPFCVETFGAWGFGAQECLKRILKVATNSGHTNIAYKGSWGAPHLSQLAT